MKKFKYLIVSCANTPTEERLNEYGNDGWQIVSFKEINTPFFNPISKKEETQVVTKIIFMKEIICSI